MREAPVNNFSALFQPGNIGTLRLENRLIMPAMGNNLADEGKVTERQLDYYQLRARGGVGLVVIQFTSVTAEDTTPHHLALYDDKFIPGLRRLVETIHGEGAKACVQLMHWGLALLLVGLIPEGMSIKVPSITSWMPGDRPYKEVDEKDIDRYVEDFAEAARRVKEAGADAVEFHACHGCLLSTFLSPAINRRTDQYGGSVENRTRFARRIVEKTKEKAGREFPVLVRINGSDDVEGGVTLDEVLRQAAILEGAGADAISISVGHEFWSPLTMPCYALPEGLYVPLAERVKNAVKVPVITAGKIGPELAEQIIKDGKADFVALGRPLLADPDLPNKLRQGRREDVRSCLYCNNCLRAGRGSCSVNPFLYREGRFPPTPAKQFKRVMVVGGGLAGMQAAVLLAQRGHQVSLHERESELGGQWNIASAMPGKESYASFTDYLRRSLDKHGVPITVSTEVTKEKVIETKPDAIVVATGATPQVLNVPGSTGPNVVQANDIIKGETAAKGKVVIIGGRFIGMELAVWLAEQGKEVSLVTRTRLGGRVAVERFTYRTLTRQLIELRVPLYLDTSVLEITENGVVIGLGEEVFFLPADTVVLAVGVEPDNKLAQELEGVVPEVYTIGDCNEPLDAAAAVYDAAKIAFNI
jgi:2,4-dienoyl-CoA reductase-like NADH-dependent reductase (Old Yellow Enzyme family)/thioredoxin reductase